MELVDKPWTGTECINQFFLLKSFHEWNSMQTPFIHSLSWNHATLYANLSFTRARKRKRMLHVMNHLSLSLPLQLFCRDFMNENRMEPEDSPRASSPILSISLQVPQQSRPPPLPWSNGPISFRFARPEPWRMFVFFGSTCSECFDLALLTALHLFFFFVFGFSWCFGIESRTVCSSFCFSLPNGQGAWVWVCVFESCQKKVFVSFSKFQIKKVQSKKKR